MNALPVSLSPKPDTHKTNPPVFLSSYEYFRVGTKTFSRLAVATEHLTPKIIKGTGLGHSTKNPAWKLGCDLPKYIDRTPLDKCPHGVVSQSPGEQSPLCFLCRGNVETGLIAHIAGKCDSGCVPSSRKDADGRTRYNCKCAIRTVTLTAKKPPKKLKADKFASSPVNHYTGLAQQTVYRADLNDDVCQCAGCVADFPARLIICVRPLVLTPTLALSGSSIYAGEVLPWYFSDEKVAERGELRFIDRAYLNGLLFFNQESDWLTCQKPEHKRAILARRCPRAPRPSDSLGYVPPELRFTKYTLGKHSPIRTDSGFNRGMYDGVPRITFTDLAAGAQAAALQNDLVFGADPDCIETVDPRADLTREEYDYLESRPLTDYGQGEQASYAREFDTAADNLLAALPDFDVEEFNGIGTQVGNEIVKLLLDIERPYGLLPADFAISNYRALVPTLKPRWRFLCDVARQLGGHGGSKLVTEQSVANLLGCNRQKIKYAKQVIEQTHSANVRRTLALNRRPLPEDYMLYRLTVLERVWRRAFVDEIYESSRPKHSST